MKDKRLRLNSDRCYECGVGSGGRDMGGEAQIYRIIEGSCSLGYCWNSKFHLQRRCLWVRWRGRHVSYVWRYLDWEYNALQNHLSIMNFKLDARKLSANRRPHGIVVCNIVLSIPNIVKHRAHVCLEHVLTEHDGLVWDLVINTLSVESKRSKTTWMAKSIFNINLSHAKLH